MALQQGVSSSAAIIFSSSSSSSSTITTSSSSYDVFLSFRGPGIRHQFCDHLYNLLCKNQIKTFRDDKDANKGNFITEEIDLAIKQSRFSIIILSQKFASSEFCLDELVEIIKRHKLKVHRAFPIFYHVHPNDVGDQTGYYKGDFLGHEINFKEKVQGWRNALRQVSLIAGWHKRIDHGSETQLIEEIVAKILEELRRTSQRIVKQLVRLNSTSRDAYDRFVRSIYEKYVLCEEFGFASPAKWFRRIFEANKIEINMTREHNTFALILDDVCVPEPQVLAALVIDHNLLGPATTFMVANKNRNCTSIRILLLCLDKPDQTEKVTMLDHERLKEMHNKGGEHIIIGTLENSKLYTKLRMTVVDHKFTDHENHLVQHILETSVYLEDDEKPTGSNKLLQIIIDSDTSQNINTLTIEMEAEEVQESLAVTACKTSLNMSLKRVVGLHNNFSKAQRSAIDGVGFGGLLQLNFTTLDRELCEWLVSRFDVNSRMLNVHGWKISITPRDVEHILGLSADGVDVILSDGMANLSILSKDVTIKGGHIQLDDLVKILSAANVVDDIDEFVRHYILFVIEAILCPTMKHGVSPLYLGSVKNMEVVSQSNWAKFVLDFLVSGIAQHQNQPQHEVSGCLVFLMVFYLEHVRTGNGETYQPILHRKRPRIQHWDDSRIQNKLEALKSMDAYKRYEVELLVDDGIETLEAACTTQRLGDMEKCLVALKNDVESIRTDVSDLRQALSKMGEDMRSMECRILAAIRSMSNAHKRNCNNPQFLPPGLEFN